MKIAVDFDGVLHGYSKGWSDGSIYDPPVPGAKEAMKRLKEQGHTLYIFSTRTNPMFKNKDASADQKKAMEAWMGEHDIPFDKVWTFGKPMADLFIDDRAIGFRGQWEQTLREVDEFKVWTKTEE
jgi:ribonucleotide monophosphatase NagD (HAD superfamily)